MTDQFWPGPADDVNTPVSPPPAIPRRGRQKRNDGTGQGDKYRAVRLALGEEPTVWIGRWRDPVRTPDPKDPSDRGGAMVYSAIAERINRLLADHPNGGFRVSHEFARRWDPTNAGSPAYVPPEPPPKKTRRTGPPPAKFQPPAAGPAA